MGSRRMAGAGQYRRGSRYGGASLEFDFAQFSSPVLHLWDRAADITVTGAGVSAWTNRAGGMTVSQGTDGDRPEFLGQGSGVDFDIANTEHLTLGSIPALTSGAFTLFLDLDIQSNAATRYLLDLNGTNRLIFALGGASGNMAFFDGSFRTAAANAWAPTTGRQIVTMRYNGPGSIGEMRRDKVSLGTAAVGTAASIGGGTGTISRAATSAAAWVDAFVYRMILYPVSLSDGQMLATEQAIQDQR